MSDKTFICSDLHINHTNIAGKAVSKWRNGYRHYNSVDEMNRTILKNINDKVGQKDKMFFLGDFCFGDHTLTAKWREQIICENIIFIKGNHDKHIYKYASSFNGIYDKYETTIEGQHIIFSHYPELSWKDAGSGSWMVHGHCHANINVDKMNESCKRFDAGIDSYYKLFGIHAPFEFGELRSIMNKKPISCPDHHS
jgi:calcineurin-like phosphoesterase family protein